MAPWSSYLKAIGLITAVGQVDPGQQPIQLPATKTVPDYFDTRPGPYAGIEQAVICPVVEGSD
jgi:hypothetical protein